MFSRLVHVTLIGQFLVHASNQTQEININSTNLNDSAIKEWHNKKSVSVTTNIQKYVAFDCSISNSLEYEEFSLMDVDQCKNTAVQYDNPEFMEALIIKPRDSISVEVIECNLRASFMVNYCSYNLLTGYRLWEGNIVGNNIQLHLSKSECIQAVRYHQLRYMDRLYYQKYNYILLDLKQNGQAKGWKTLRGSLNAKEGTCTPESFALMGEQYSNHVLQMHYEVNTKISKKDFNIKNRVLRLNEHLVLDNVISGSYFDPTYGNFHWNKNDISNTSHQIWQEVLKGKAQLYNPKQSNITKPIIIITMENDSIALTLEEKERICIQKFHSCREAYKTASKDIYIIITKHPEINWKLEMITADNVDKLEDIKASTISIFLSNSLEIEKSFSKISRILCEKSRNLILTDIKKYLSRMPTQRSTSKGLIEAGSTIYSVNCKNRLVWLSPQKSICYKEPRIAYIKENNNYITYAHIHPITHHIQPNSTTIQCDGILPFKIAMKTLDDKLEFFCRNNNGWTPTNCEASKQISPLATEELYKTNTKKIHMSLFGSVSNNLLNSQQWYSVTNEGKSQMMLKMFEEIRESSPPNKNIFEVMMQRITSKIMRTPGNWFRTLSEAIAPGMYITYGLNILKGLTMAPSKIKGKIKNETHLTALLIAITVILKTFFPIMIKQKHKCRCEDETFIPEITKQIQDQERTRFLQNLMH